MAENELDKWTKESIEAMSAAFPSGKYGTWEQCQVLLPHAKEVLVHETVDSNGAVEQASIASRAGWYSKESGEYAAAEELLRLSLETQEKSLGREHPDTLKGVSRLGLILDDQGSITRQRSCTDER